VKKSEALKIIGYNGAARAGGITLLAYTDFRNDLKKSTNSKHFSPEENFDVLTFSDFLLAESIFNHKHKKYRHCKSIITIREENNCKKKNT
jgi:hypothetical protein